MNPPLLKDNTLRPGELNPADHVRMLIELLRPLGPELARRWVVALLSVDAGDRQALVEAIERRVSELYSGAPERPKREVRLVRPPAQRDGYVEQVETTFEVPAASAPAKRPARARRAR